MYSTLTSPFQIDTRCIFDYEIILVCDGECKITTDDKEYICKKDDVIFIRPGVHHSFKNTTEADFFQPHIHFDVVYTEKSEERTISFKKKSSMTDYEISLIAEDVFEDIAIPIVFSPSNIDKFKKTFFEIIEIFCEKEYNYELMYKSKMLVLIDYIIKQFEVNHKTDKDSLLDPVSMIKNYIDNNYLSLISLDSITKQFQINKYTLIRKFKTSYKQNIMSYYRDKRIEYIKKALTTTSLSITVLADKLNFNDIYSFSRFFKKHTGYSPTEYRNSNKYKF